MQTASVLSALQIRSVNIQNRMDAQGPVSSYLQTLQQSPAIAQPLHFP